MGAAQKIGALLPSLWRPEEGESGLLAALVAAAGAELDRVRIAAGDTMQAHWLGFADSALLSSYMSLARREAGKPPLLPSDPETAAFPYIVDLAGLAGLLGLVPFAEPPEGRESVEAFRARIRETVALWQEGLGTRAAIAGTAALSLSGLAERAVAIEEFAPREGPMQAVTAAGAPGDMVGPLMRWRATSDTLAPAQLEIAIEGVAPDGGRVDATVNPLVERFDPTTGTGAGVGWEGTVAPGKTLLLRPTYISWLATAKGVRAATALPSSDVPADPTAAGPWATEAAVPAKAVRALARTADGSVWAALPGSAGTFDLWRRGAGGWATALAGLPEIFCLVGEEDALFVGHANGLSRLSVFDAAPALAPDPGTAGRSAVRALARDAGGMLWAGTADGPAQVGTRLGLSPVGPGTRAKTATAVRAVLAEPDRIVWFGGASGLFRYDIAADHWHAYDGASADETVPDWLPWPDGDDAPPRGAAPFLPPVTALLRTPDQSLWIGTERGLARYRARRHRGAYATRLDAFPELGSGTVNALALDERQRLWAATDRGLLLFDGAHWFQARGGALQRLPAAGHAAAETTWRFDRAADEWQSALAGDPAGFRHKPVAPVTSAEDPVTAILWSDGVVAELDGKPAPGRVLGRIKPDPTRILDMAIPAIPRLPPGGADFRYLRYLAAEPPAPKTLPAWTAEGRLLTPRGLAPAPHEGRHLAIHAAAPVEPVFAYNPAAKVHFRVAARLPFSVTVRLEKLAADDVLPPPVVARLRGAIAMVRPAGVRVRLAHGEDPVEGEDDG